METDSVKQLWSMFDRARNEDLSLTARAEAARSAMELLESHPDAEMVAALRGGIADSLSQKFAGQEPELQELALQAARQALDYYEAKGDFENAAYMHRSIASVLIFRHAGNRAENLESALRHADSALQQFTPTSSQSGWADMQVLRANALAQPSCPGHPADNIRLAIKILEEVLPVLRALPQLHWWANAKNTLGTLYTLRLSGRRLENAENPINALADAENVLKMSGSP